MKPETQFGGISLAAAGAVIMLAQGFHPILLASIQLGQTAAWLAMVLAGLYALALYLVVAAPLRAIPGGNLIDLARAAAGQPGAIITALLVCSMLVFHAALIVRQTSEMAVGAIYTHTPQTFATVTLICCTLYAAYGNLAAVIRLVRGFLPVLLLAILLILIGGSAWGRPRFLLPFWGPGPAPLVLGAGALTGLFCPLVLFLLIAADGLNDRSRLPRAGVMAIGGSALVLTFIKVILLMSYPLPLGYSITFPLHELARLVVGGRFFERIEGLWVLVWVFATACHLGALLHAAARAFANAFDIPSYRPAVLPLVFVAMAAAFFPHDQGQSVALGQDVLPVYAAIGLALPVVLALTVTVRRWVSRGT